MYEILPVYEVLRMPYGYAYAYLSECHMKHRLAIDQSIDQLQDIMRHIEYCQADQPEADWPPGPWRGRTCALSSALVQKTPMDPQGACMHMRSTDL